MKAYMHVSFNYMFTGNYTLKAKICSGQSLAAVIKIKHRSTFADNGNKYAGLTGIKNLTDEKSKTSMRLETPAVANNLSLRSNSMLHKCVLVLLLLFF